MEKIPVTLKLNEVGIGDIEIVGGKNASLGEMIQHLTILGINIPSGFVITIMAYNEFIRYNSLEDEITRLLKNIDYTSVESLRRVGLQIRSLIRNGRFPQEM